MCWRRDKSPSNNNNSSSIMKISKVDDFSVEKNIGFLMLISAFGPHNYIEVFIKYLDLILFLTSPSKSKIQIPICKIDQLPVNTTLVWHIKKGMLSVITTLFWICGRNTRLIINFNAFVLA